MATLPSPSPSSSGLFERAVEWDEASASKGMVKYHSAKKVESKRINRRICECGYPIVKMRGVAITPACGTASWTVRVGNTSDKESQYLSKSFGSVGVVRADVNCRALEGAEYEWYPERKAKLLWTMWGNGVWSDNVEHVTSTAADLERAEFGEGDIVTITFNPSSMRLSVSVEGKFQTSGVLKGCDGHVSPCVYLTGDHETVEIVGPLRTECRPPTSLSIQGIAESQVTQSPTPITSPLRMKTPQSKSERTTWEVQRQSA